MIFEKLAFAGYWPSGRTSFKGNSVKAIPSWYRE